MLIDQILVLPAGSVGVADIGAAFYGEVPPYQRLIPALTGAMPPLYGNVSDKAGPCSSKL